MLACFIWNYLSLQPVNRKQCELKKNPPEKQFIRKCFITCWGKRCISKSLSLQVTRLAGKWCWGKLVYQNTNFWVWRVFHKYNHKFFNYPVHPSYHITIFPSFFQTLYKCAWLKEGRVCISYIRSVHSRNFLNAGQVGGEVWRIELYSWNTFSSSCIL